MSRAVAITGIKRAIIRYLGREGIRVDRTVCLIVIKANATPTVVGLISAYTGLEDQVCCTGIIANHKKDEARIPGRTREPCHVYSRYPGGGNLHRCRPNPTGAGNHARDPVRSWNGLVNTWEGPERLYQPRTYALIVAGAVDINRVTCRRRRHIKINGIAMHH